MRIFNQLDHTHMPFIVDEGNMLFCKAPFKDRVLEDDKVTSVMGEGGNAKTSYQSYDLYGSKLDGTEEYFIGNGLDSAFIACSPNCYTKKDGTVVLNYVRTSVKVLGLHYHHFIKEGNSLQELGKQKRLVNKYGVPSYCTSENNRYIFIPTCSLGKPILRFYDKEFQVDQKKVFNCDQIKRTQIVANSDNKIVMTYIKDKQIRSGVYNVETDEFKDIKVNGEHVYKCSIFNDIIVYAKKNTGSVYSRQLHKDTYTLEDCDV